MSGTIADGLADSCSWVVPSSLVFFFCVEDDVGGGGSQPLGAILVEWGVVPGLDHQIAGLDFAGAGLGYVVAVRGAVEHIAAFCDY